MNTVLVQYCRLVLARWRWPVWGMLLALLAATIVLIVYPPLYRSQSTVFVRTPGDISKVQDGGDLYARARADTYAALAESTGVSARVVADLGLALTPEEMAGRVRAENRPNTALLDIAVMAPSSSEAQRTATVVVNELAATMRTLESVPGSLVPRAELVVVNPPGEPKRVLPWGIPVVPVLLAVALLGGVLGAVGAVLRSLFADEVADETDQTDAEAVDDPPTVPMAIAVRRLPGTLDNRSEALSDAPRDDLVTRATGRHRRADEQPKANSGDRQ